VATPRGHRRWHRTELQSWSLEPAVDVEHSVDRAHGAPAQRRTLGARGIRTLVAGYSTNRLSRKHTEPDWPRLGPSPEYKRASQTDSNRLDPTSGWHRRWHRRIGHHAYLRSLTTDTRRRRIPRHPGSRISSCSLHASFPTPCANRAAPGWRTSSGSTAQRRARSPARCSDGSPPTSGSSPISTKATTSTRRPRAEM
jgi:hypothetical protein